MKAIILVGGKGTRMRPLTLDLPKPLLPIANIAFISRQILWLKSFGVNEVVLSLCYLPDQFIEHFNNNPIDGINISYVVEETPLGTGGAIKYAAGEVEESVIVCNGDVLTQINLGELIDLHSSKNSLATISLTRVEDPSAFGVVPTDEDQKVIAFVEKPSKGNAPSNWINAGIYIVSKEFLDLIPEQIEVSVERETFPRAIAEGAMYALESKAYWLDIGTVNKYIQAHCDFVNDLSKDCDFGIYSEVTSNIFSSGEIEIAESTIAKSKCLIGKSSRIGENVILNASSIGENVKIGANSTISNSVIFDDVVIGDDVQIHDSVVGKNTTINDGVKIEEFSVVGSDQIIPKDSTLISQRIPQSE